MKRLLLFIGVFSACGTSKSTTNAALPVSPPTTQTTTPATEAASQGVKDPALKSILEAHWDQLMRSAPLWATSLGDRRFDHLLPNNSKAAQDEERKKRDQLIAETSKLRPTEAQDQITQALFIELLESRKGLDACDFESWSFSPRNNPLSLFNNLHDSHPIDTLVDAENYLRRIDAIPGFLAQEIRNLRTGIQAGMVANKESSEKVLQMTEASLEKETDAWPLLQAKAPEGFDLQTPIRERIEQVLRPSLVTYRDFLRDEIIPNARGEKAEGLSHLPVGEACYQGLIKYHTTLSKTPQELHELGKSALKSIHSEMETMGQRLFQQPTIDLIFNTLRTDPSLRFDNESQVEDKAKSALALAKLKMAEAFDPVPQTDCVVERIPDYEAPFTTIAYYRPPATDGSRPGTYFVNTYAPETRPRFEAEVLAYHEAIPGHHLQIALAQEQDSIPLFRRVMHMTAFVEGWALYSERLSDEMGMYTGDLDRMGMLSFDSWRAARLVVDTGLHAMGWTRQEAIDFMEKNTPLALNNIANEVDRYITTPGQALAYKVGQIEILRLRKMAKDALGQDFNLKTFHRIVLGGGAVSLQHLEKTVQDWVLNSKKENDTP